MKGGGSLFVLIILLITCLYTSSVFSQGTLPPDFPSRGTRETIQLEWQNRTREFTLFIPEDFDESTLTPLVINIHGLTSNSFEQQLLSWFNLVADREKFLVAYPQGHLTSFAAGPVCCPPANILGVDDVGFIREIVAMIRSRFNVDSSRIFSTGMSNGSFMSIRLACDASDLFRAIGSVAGSSPYGKRLLENCTPQRVLPMLHFHGTDDKLVDYNDAVLTIENWIKMSGCTTNSKQSYQRGDATCISYTECPNNDDNMNITLCTIEGGQHSWPGATAYEQPTQDIGATEEIWNFFKRFPSRISKEINH